MPAVDPRPHHYLFAHLRLRQLALADPARFVDAVRQPGFLATAWAAVAAEVPEADRLPDDGLGGEVSGRRGARIAVVRLPTPLGASECWFLAVRTEVPRMLTLEHSWDVVAEEWGTALGVWTDADAGGAIGAGEAGGAEHELLESGVPVEEKAFLAEARARLV